MDDTGSGINEGIDLSEVPVCVLCGLEMANRDEHEIWHQGVENTIRTLEKKIESLDQLVKNLLTVKSQTPSQPMTYPHQPQFISDEEIRKYSRPGQYPPKFKSGDKWGL